jgi:hypothetical protein
VVGSNDKGFIVDLSKRIYTLETFILTEGNVQNCKAMIKANSALGFVWPVLKENLTLAKKF